MSTEKDKTQLYSLIAYTVEDFTEHNPDFDPADVIGILLQSAAEFAIAATDMTSSSEELPLLIRATKKQLGSQMEAAVLLNSHGKLN